MEKEKRAKRTLLTKLHLEHDLARAAAIANPELVGVRKLPEGGRIRRAMGMFQGKLRDLISINLLVMLTLVPAAVLILYLMPLWSKEAVTGLNFSGNYGVGYPGALDDTMTGAVAVYTARLTTMYYLVPCFTLFGISMAGAFYCMRNYGWETVNKGNRLRSFFMGVKKFGIPFALAFSVIGGFVLLVGYSVLNHLIMDVQGGAPAWSYALMVFSCLFALLLMVFLLFFLPHIMCYKMKLRYHIKNALVFSVSLFPIAIINLALMSVPFLLLLIPGFGSIIFYMVAVFVLWGYLSLWFVSVGQYAFDNYIERTLDTLDVEKQRQLMAERNREKKKPEQGGGNKRPPHASYRKKKK